MRPQLPSSFHDAFFCTLQGNQPPPPHPPTHPTSKARPCFLPLFFLAPCINFSSMSQSLHTWNQSPKPLSVNISKKPFINARPIDMLMLLNFLHGPSGESTIFFFFLTFLNGCKAFVFSSQGRLPGPVKDLFKYVKSNLYSLFHTEDGLIGRSFLFKGQTKN